MKVGFAAETQDLRENARATRSRRKGLDLIVANDVAAPTGAASRHDTNVVTLIDAAGARRTPVLTKYDVGHRILDRVAALCRSAERD